MMIGKSWTSGELKSFMFQEHIEEVVCAKCSREAGARRPTDSALVISLIGICTDVLIGLRISKGSLTDRKRYPYLNFGEV